MYIDHLIIKNFRCFGSEGTEIKFDQNCTGIIGKNGSGKTSVLEALNLVFGKDYALSKINERDFNNLANNVKDKIEIIVYTNKPFFVSNEITYTVETSGFRQNAQVIIACKGFRLTVKRREKAERILDEPFTIEKYAIPIEGNINEEDYNGVISEKEKPVIKSTLSKDVGYYNISFKLKSGEVRHTRLFEYQLTYNQSKYKKFPIAYYLNREREKELGNNYSIFSKILTDIHWRYRKNQGDDCSEFLDNYNPLASYLRQVDEKGRLINSIRTTVNDITCDNNDYYIDFLDFNEPYKDAFISKNLSNRQLTTSNLGSGYHILFAYALARYIFQIEKEPVLFLIDEPEMHLHIDWQQRLYQKFINEKNIQIIFSTQSENFISLKYWKSIKLFKSSTIFPNNQSTNILVDVNGTSYPISDLINDYAERNLHISTFLRENLELFFTDKCILVEGPAEKYALPKLLSLVGIDLSCHSVSIISVWGKGKMKQYQLLCKCFGINFYTLYDQDRKPGEIFDNNTENKSINDNATVNQVSFFSISFEDALGADGFQKVVKRTDEITSINDIGEELKEKLTLLKKFIETN